MPDVPGPDALKNTWDLSNEFIDLAKQGKRELTPFQVSDMEGKLNEEPSCLFEVLFSRLFKVLLFLNMR